VSAPGTRLTVFVMKTNEITNETTWVKGGSAFVNRDGSVNVYLDVLPLDGRLHIRDETEKKEPV
jgi:hypothetical protein